MNKIIWRYGLPAGLISIAWPVLGESLLPASVSYQIRVLLGYVFMVMAFSLIYAALKTHRDRYNQGLLSFVQALKISLLITLVASTVYVGIWMIDFYVFMPDFVQQYTRITHSQLVASGAGVAEINKAMAELATSMQRYQNPFYNALATYGEILPVGIVCSFIGAALIRKSAPALAPVSQTL